MPNSIKKLDGYRILAGDGEVGRVAYLIVDTHNGRPGKQVLVSPEWIQAVNWGERTVSVALTRAQIEQTPEYDPK